MLATLLLRTSLAFAALDNDGDGFDADVDCNDADVQVHPQAVELCDSVDNNCNGQVDEDSAVDAVTWFEDNDGDGYMNGDAPHQACPDQTTSPWVREVGLDCDDEDADVGPCPTGGSCSVSPSGTGASGLAALGLLALRRRHATRR